MERLIHTSDQPHHHVRIPTWVLWATLPAVLSVAAFGLWLRLSLTGPTPLDTWWLDVVGLSVDSTPYRVAVTLAEVGGGTGALICTALAAVLFTLLRRIRAALVLVTTMLLGVGLSELIKVLVSRVRPSEQLYDSLGYSYPSGHSMGAAALAAGLALIVTRAHTLRHPEPAQLHFHWSMLVAAGWIAAMMWSRTALQVHWLTDTIAGVLVGLTAAIVADEVWTRLERRTRSPLLQR